MFKHRRYVTHDELADITTDLNRRISLMATQADIDALTTQINQVATDLATAKTTLQAEIDKLAGANPSLDLTALQAAVAPLDSAVQALGQLQPAPPAPAAG